MTRMVQCDFCGELAAEHEAPDWARVTIQRRVRCYPPGKTSVKDVCNVCARELHWMDPDEEIEGADAAEGD